MAPTSLLLLVLCIAGSAVADGTGTRVRDVGAGSSTPTSAPTCTLNTTAAEIAKGTDLSEQVHVLTGGDSGIGFEMAAALAAQNATIVILSVEADTKGREAAANITAATGNTKITVLQLDLSKLASVRSCASKLNQTLKRLDVLVCDAGIVYSRIAGLGPTTGDGFDRTFQVNFLGHMLLVDLMLPLLRFTTGRIINMASEASFDPCTWGNRPANCTSVEQLRNDATTSPTGTNAMGVNASNYGLTKYLQVFHAAELARREYQYGPPAGHVSVYSVHPGFVETPMTKHIKPAVRKAWCQGATPCPLTAAEGGATPTYLATARYDELITNDGAYFVLCKPTDSVRTDMVDHVGQAATLAYQVAVFDLLLSWTK